MLSYDEDVIQLDHSQAYQQLALAKESCGYKHTERVVLTLNYDLEYLRLHGFFSGWWIINCRAYQEHWSTCSLVKHFPPGNLSNKSSTLGTGYLSSCMNLLIVVRKSPLTYTGSRFFMTDTISAVQSETGPIPECLLWKTTLVLLLSTALHT